LFLNRHENGEWRGLRNEEFHSLYHLPNIVKGRNKYRRLIWVGHVARMEENRRAINNFYRQTYRKDIFRKIKSRWKNNIKMDLKEISVNMRNWIIWLRIGVMNLALNLLVPGDCS
jgi:hypothetical protein